MAPPFLAIQWSSSVVLPMPSHSTIMSLAMRMITGGVGLGIGAQNYDLILLFQTDTRLNEFLTGSWDANTSAQAAAGTDGVGVASTFIDGVAVYQITDAGLMAWADVSGTRFRVLQELN